MKVPWERPEAWKCLRSVSGAETYAPRAVEPATGKAVRAIRQWVEGSVHGPPTESWGSRCRLNRSLARSSRCREEQPSMAGNRNPFRRVLRMLSTVPLLESRIRP